MTFGPFEAEDNGVPVVEQHEEYHRELVRFKRSEHGGHLGLDEFMSLCRQSRETARAAAEARGEFFTTSSGEWARHLLGPDADMWAVNDLSIEIHQRWRYGEAGNHA